MSVFINEQELINKVRKNKIYKTAAEKKMHDVFVKKKLYEKNKKIIRLYTAKRYYTNKLKKDPENESIKEKIENIDKEINDYKSHQNINDKNIQ